MRDDVRQCGTQCSGSPIQNTSSAFSTSQVEYYLLKAWEIYMRTSTLTCGTRITDLNDGWLGGSEGWRTYEDSGTLSSNTKLSWMLELSAHLSYPTIEVLLGEVSAIVGFVYYTLFILYFYLLSERSTCHGSASTCGEIKSYPAKTSRWLLPSSWFLVDDDMK